MTPTHIDVLTEIIPELFYLLNEVMANAATRATREEINLYDANAEEQSHDKVTFLSLESK